MVLDEDISCRTRILAKRNVPINRHVELFDTNRKWCVIHFDRQILHESLPRQKGI